MRVIFPKNIVFISKPRCGSTSVRNVLTKFIRQNYPNSDSSDLIINTKKFNYHPHITGPYLKDLLNENYRDSSKDLEYFTVIRNPLNMLSSYYDYFKPDQNCHYFYSELHNSTSMGLG